VDQGRKKKEDGTVVRSATVRKVKAKEEGEIIAQVWLMALREGETVAGTIFVRIRDPLFA
jgi:hypothetical protein